MPCGIMSPAAVRPKIPEIPQFVVGFGFHFHLKIHLKMEKYIVFRLKMRIKTSKTVTEGWPDQKETD